MCTPVIIRTAAGPVQGLSPLLIVKPAGTFRHPPWTASLPRLAADWCACPIHSPAPSPGSPYASTRAVNFLTGNPLPAAEGAAGAEDRLPRTYCWCEPGLRQTAFGAWTEQPVFCRHCHLPQGQTQPPGRVDTCQHGGRCWAPGAAYDTAWLALLPCCQPARRQTLPAMALLTAAAWTQERIAQPVLENREPLQDLGVHLQPKAQHLHGLPMLPR